MNWGACVVRACDAGAALIDGRCQVMTLSSQLTCGMDGMATPVTTDRQSVTGSSVSVRVGITRQIGGVGTEFVLSANGTSIDILAAASAAGAGWQTSALRLDPQTQRININNQGAGNSYQGQWGYAVQLDGLRQTDWTPLYDDHYQPNASFSNPSVGQSPCDPSTGDQVFDYGQFNISGSAIATGAGARIAHLENAYSFASANAQSMTWFQAEQAIYLDRTVALKQHLRVVLVGQNNAWSEEVSPQNYPANKEGPFYAQANGQQGYGCDDQGCGLHSGNLAYAMLIYNVGGTDVGVVVHRPNGSAFQSQLNLELNTNFGRGGVNFHSWLEDGYAPPPGNFSAGQVRTYAMAYEVGTLAELAQMGFVVPTKTLAMGRASSNDELWPAARVVDGDPTTSFSSQAFDSAANSRGSALSAWLADGPAAVARVNVRARLLNGAPNGFATNYDVYLTAADDSRWVKIGNFAAAPDVTGLAVIDLGDTYLTHGVMLVPQTIGQDSFGNFYFQLAELSLSP